MQKRILLAIIASVFVILATVGVVSYLRVGDSIKRSYADRIAMADIIGKYVEHIIEENLTRLYDISLSDRIDFEDRDWGPERAALKAAYQYSIFSEGLFLLDLRGNVLMTYPYRESGMVNLLGNPHVARVVSERRPVISNIYTEQPTGKKVVYCLVPLRNRSGQIVGAAGGVINPATAILGRMLQTVQAETTSRYYIEVIDANEVVIISTLSGRVLEHHDHGGVLGSMIRDRRSGVKNCDHGYSQDVPGTERDILAFVPLHAVPWGVILGQPERELFSPSEQLKKNFIFLAVIFAGSAALFAVGVSNTIVSPIRSLTSSANAIARGDLSKPVGDIGTDEIAVLARSFEVMRERLARSLESLGNYNVELEEHVYERTVQLEEKRKQNELLFKKLITTQEDERRRIARELHDESLQNLSALLMGMEMCKLHPAQVTAEKVDSMKGIVTTIINEMNNLIQNLRPTVLDDLGFEAAVAWMLDRNVRDKGMYCLLNMDELSTERFTPEIEITLFRILQEASMNIARHAHARNVFVHMGVRRGMFFMSIEDDGEGFDTGKALVNTLSGRGLGILGMKERAALLNGNLTVCSAPGEGTMLLLRMPLPRAG